ncbi:MAG: hypothetical protein QOG96_6685, partial [Pseudonocardiales bacterium]|nr:hypothetical protein [Pseudonocardiales bacterium]
MPGRVGALTDCAVGVDQVHMNT